LAEFASLDGKVALVTGGSRGIGAAISRELARGGARVAVNYRSGNEAASAIAAEIGGVALGANVGDPAEVQELLDRVESELGDVDVLVNNAGVTRDNLLFKMSDDDWDTVMSVHLRGSFLMSRACQAHMVDAGYGRMVFLSSTSALGNRGQANYASAKAGLQGLAKTLAIELGKFGITANAIAPGFIETDMTAATAARVGVDFEEFKKATAATIPVNRTGKPEDIAAAASFFCSEEAGFVSGQVLYVAGGPRN
jgi:3-oxoacyl-[acyl-carrier protein] reductase